MHKEAAMGTPRLVGTRKLSKADHVSSSAVGDGGRSTSEAKATHHDGEKDWFLPGQGGGSAFA